MLILEKSPLAMETFSSCNQFCLTVGQSQWMLLQVSDSPCQTQVPLRSNEDKNYSGALSSQRDGPGLRRGRVGGRPDLRAPHPTPPGAAHTHARPLGGPGSPPDPRPGQAAAGQGLAGFGGLAAPSGWSLVPARSAQVQRAPRHGEVRRLAPPASKSEREAQRRVLRAPGSSRLRLPDLV